MSAKLAVPSFSVTTFLKIVFTFLLVSKEIILLLFERAKFRSSIFLSGKVVTSTSKMVSQFKIGSINPPLVSEYSSSK